MTPQMIKGLMESATEVKQEASNQLEILERELNTNPHGWHSCVLIPPSVSPPSPISKRVVLFYAGSDTQREAYGIGYHTTEPVYNAPNWVDFQHFGRVPDRWCLIPDDNVARVQM